MSRLVVRRARETDAPDLCRIYNHYVLNTGITFETEAVSPAAMSERIRQKLSGHDWLVAEAAGVLTGYAYYGPYRERAAYRQTVESTIYLDPAGLGRGYGLELYSELVSSAVQHRFRTLIAVIALPNPASLRLHARLGFREAGVLKQVGFKFGRYIDTAYWQKDLLPD